MDEARLRRHLHTLILLTLTSAPLQWALTRLTEGFTP